MPQPFHLAIPVDNLEKAREFYGELLGCKQGRSDTQWIDWDLAGHQLVTHLVKALPWMSTVRKKLVDPAYRGFFLPFRHKAVPLCNGSTPCTTTRCDHNYKPPRCSNLYHDQDQSPQHPQPHRRAAGSRGTIPPDHPPSESSAAAP